MVERIIEPPMGSQEEAKKYNSDDGLLYLLNEFSPEEMLNEMMKEIENEI